MATGFEVASDLVAYGFAGILFSSATFQGSGTVVDPQTEIDQRVADAYAKVRADGSTVVLYGIGREHLILRSQVVHRKHPRLYQIGLVPNRRFLVVSPEMVATGETNFAYSQAAFLDANCCISLLPLLRKPANKSSNGEPLRQYLDSLHQRGIQLFAVPYVAESLGRRSDDDLRLPEDLRLLARYLLTTRDGPPEEGRIASVVAAWGDWANNDIAATQQQGAYALVLKACLIANAPDPTFPDSFAELAAFLHFDFRAIAIRNYATVCEIFGRRTGYFKGLNHALGERTWDRPKKGVRDIAKNIAWDMAHVQVLELNFFMAADGADYEPGVLLTHDKKMYQMHTHPPYVLNSIAKRIDDWRIEPSGILINPTASGAIEPYITPEAAQERREAGDADLDALIEELEAKAAAVFGSDAAPT